MQTHQKTGRALLLLFSAQGAQIYNTSETARAGIPVPATSGRSALTDAGDKSEIAAVAVEAISAAVRRLAGIARAGALAASEAFAAGVSDAAAATASAATAIRRASAAPAGATAAVSMPASAAGTATLKQRIATASAAAVSATADAAAGGAVRPGLGPSGVATAEPTATAARVTSAAVAASGEPFTSVVADVVGAAFVDATRAVAADGGVATRPIVERRIAAKCAAISRSWRFAGRSFK